MVKEKILVTGGAGYIGTHLVKNLLKANYDVTVIDNLSAGFIEPIQIIQEEFGDPPNSAGKFEFIKGDLSDTIFLEKIFSRKDIEAVIHLAAKTDAAESVVKPDLYHQENYINSINLVEALTAAGIDKLIFSSTAAVYGNPKYTPIDEKHPTNPTNPYGQTKLDFEKYLARTENLKYIILRYFNVGGSDPSGFIGKSHLQSQDLIENILKVALNQKSILKIFGDNYQTPDGTAIRDFIHVEDIAQAHILALKNIADHHGLIFNLGSEKGFSVKEIIDKASLITGKVIPTQTDEPRAGDIAISVASSQKARQLLGWNPQYSDLEQIILTDWNWRKTYPDGYNIELRR